MQQHKRVISVLDPAIDFAAVGEQGMTRYATERDISFIEKHIIPGKKPQVFVLKPIGQRLFSNYVHAASIDAVRCQRAFECALERVENLRMDDGTQVPWQPARAGTEKVGLTEEELNLFSGHEIQEIGSAAWFSSFLPRWTVGAYRLPPTCHAVLEQTLLQLVAQSRADASPNSDEPSDSTKATAEAADSTAA